MNRRVSRAKSRRLRCRTRPALSEPRRHHDAEGTRLTRGRDDRPAGAAREREREVARVLQVLREERHADAGSFVTDACVQQLVGRLSARVVLEEAVATEVLVFHPSESAVAVPVLHGDGEGVRGDELDVVAVEALARARATEPIEAGADVAEPRVEDEPFTRPGVDDGST